MSFAISVAKSDGLLELSLEELVDRVPENRQKEVNDVDGPGGFLWQGWGSKGNRLDGECGK
jgi:hypothetical protein